MFTKKLLTTLCMTAATFAHGAAGDPKTALITSSKPNKHNFIGLAAIKGSCILLTPEHIEPGKNFPITMVYAETPELQNQETLAKFAAPFAAIKHEFSKARFNAALLQAIKECDIKTIVPTMHPSDKIQIDDAQNQINSLRQEAERAGDIEGQTECTLLQQNLDRTRRLKEDEYRKSAFRDYAPAKVELDAIILFITLSETGLYSLQSNSGHYEIQSGKIRYSSFERPLVKPFIQPYHNEESNKDMKYVYWEAHCHQQDIYVEPQSCSPQEFAESYVRKIHYSKYNLAIDLAKFKELRAAAESTAKQAEEQS